LSAAPYGRHLLGGEKKKNNHPWARGTDVPVKSRNKKKRGKCYQFTGGV